MANARRRNLASNSTGSFRGRYAGRQRILSDEKARAPQTGLAPSIGSMCARIHRPDTISRGGGAEELRCRRKSFRPPHRVVPARTELSTNRAFLLRLVSRRPQADRAAANECFRRDTPEK